MAGHKSGKFKFTVDAVNADKRLDVFLVDAFKADMSRSFIKKVIDAKRVTKDGHPLKAHYIAAEGDEITADIPEAVETGITAENIPLKIVYEDDDIVVVDKQAGLVVHPAPGNYSGTLVNALLYHCRGLSGIGGGLRPGIVHRLDKDTSGLIVVAKNDMAHAALSGQFKSKAARRIYIALVKDTVQHDNGIIDLPIGRHPMDRKRMSVTLSASRDAVTAYKVIKRFKGFTELQLTLDTGRTHQIRVHMSHIGHPLLGDKTYGPGGGMKRQALHAKVLSFIHPSTGKPMSFESELPDDMKRVIADGKAE